MPMCVCSLLDFLEVIFPRRRRGLQRHRFFGLQTSKVSGDFILELIEIDVAGERDDRTVGVIALRRNSAFTSVERELFQMLFFAERISAIGAGPGPFAELDHQLVAGIVVQPGHRL